MLPPIAQLQDVLRRVIADKAEQGHVVDGLLHAIPGSYDALDAFGKRLASLPLREDWPYVEPVSWDEVEAECRAGASYDVPDAGERARAAFLASCCGCMLGKPFEIDPTMDEIRDALEPSGEWPLRDYASEAA